MQGGEDLNELDFFITRNINNVNWDKGLPDRLDDTSLTRLDLIFAPLKDRSKVNDQRI